MAAGAVGAIIAIATGAATMIMVTMTEIIDADEESTSGACAGAQPRWGHGSHWTARPSNPLS
jgi:hypothetical protein